MSKIGILRPIGEDEVDLILKWRNAPSVRINMYNQDEISTQEHLAWWKKTRERTDCQYFMFEASKLPLGVVAFTSINRTHSHSSWAFYAATDAPKGTGTRMEYLALEHAFNKLCLDKLHCEVLSSNSAVLRLHAKFGFKLEGTFRKQFLLNGEFIDILRLGILKSEWKQERLRLMETLTQMGLA